MQASNRLAAPSRAVGGGGEGGTVASSLCGRSADALTIIVSRSSKGKKGGGRRNLALPNCGKGRLSRAVLTGMKTGKKGEKKKKRPISASLKARQARRTQAISVGKKKQHPTTLTSGPESEAWPAYRAEEKGREEKKKEGGGTLPVLFSLRLGGKKGKR